MTPEFRKLVMKIKRQKRRAFEKVVRKILGEHLRNGKYYITANMTYNSNHGKWCKYE